MSESTTTGDAETSVQHFFDEALDKLSVELEPRLQTKKLPDSRSPYSAEFAFYTEDEDQQGDHVQQLLGKIANAADIRFNPEELRDQQKILLALQESTRKKLAFFIQCREFQERFHWYLEGKMPEFAPPIREFQLVQTSMATRLIAETIGGILFDGGNLSNRRTGDQTIPAQTVLHENALEHAIALTRRFAPVLTIIDNLTDNIRAEPLKMTSENIDGFADQLLQNWRDEELERIQVEALSEIEDLSKAIEWHLNESWKMSEIIAALWEGIVDFIKRKPPIDYHQVEREAHERLCSLKRLTEMITLAVTIRRNAQKDSVEAHQ